MFIKVSTVIVAMSTLYLTKGLHLASRRKFASSLFRSRGGSIEGRSSLCMVATSTAPADITADRLSNLRKEMKQDGLDCIIVPTEDPHMSEYTAPYYYRREYISGFTGEMTLLTHHHPVQLSSYLSAPDEVVTYRRAVHKHHFLIKIFHSVLTVSSMTY